MPYKAIIKLIPTMQATQLLGENIKVVKKKDTDMGDLVKLGATNIFGTSLIQTQAQLGNL